MDSFDWRIPTISIPARLAQLAREAPDADAVRDYDRTLSRGDLERATNGIANATLSERGAGNDIVGICAGVDARAIVAALGVLKAGRAYAGLQDTFAPAQLSELLDDADISLVLADAERADLARDIAGPARRVLVIDDIAPDDSAPDLDIDVDALATLNYTSGSTGKSKGVMHTHATMINDSGRTTSPLDPGPSDCRTMFGTLTWSSTCREFVGHLMLGSIVAPYDLRKWGPNPLARWFHEKRITMVSGMVASRQLWHTFPDERFPLVREMRLGAGTVYRRDMELARRAFPNAVLACRLATTESGLIAEYQVRPGEPIEYDVTPVGFAPREQRVLLLGENGEPVGPGDVGEIVAQGRYFALGYWRRPDLTAQRFRTDDRFGALPLYFTGDLGRIMPNGMLQHVGRKDFAVKVHGYLVPLDEIEAHLLGYDGVREACVVANELGDGNQQIVAYLVVEADRAVSIADLQTRLGAHMADYMLPRKFVFLDEMPRTHNGKINRRALPAVTNERPNLDVSYVAPSTPAERDIARIWEDVLGVNGIGVNDRFIELGGDSLQAMQIVSRVTKLFTSDLSVRELFGAPTVAEMAARVDGIAASATR